MAIINSMGIGRSKKSMGNVTYRSVRGRTIASQKRVSGASGAISKGLKGNIRKSLFAMINAFMSAHASDIQVSFNKSKYGSQRNYMFTKNYAALSSALRTLAITASSTGELPDMNDIETAISEYASANPQSIYRVKLDGFNDVYLSGDWSSDDNPVSGGSTDGVGVGTAKTTAGDNTYTAPTAGSMNFHAGARIVRDAGTVLLEGDFIPSGITAENIMYIATDGKNLNVEVTNIKSQNGALSYDAPAFTEAQNVAVVKVGVIYIRLTSAYVRTGGVDDDPLG